MKFSEISVGDWLEDEWWPFDIQGKVVKKLKTRIHLRLLHQCYIQGQLRYIGDVLSYDKTHCQFLHKMPEYSNILN